MTPRAGAEILRLRPGQANEPAQSSTTGGGDRSLGSRQAGLRPNDFTRTMGRHPAEYARRLRGMAAHGAVTARRGSIARLEQGFRTQTMASRRERTEDSPTRWRFRPPSAGTFRLQPCGGPRTASGPGFNLIALRGRRSRNGRPSLRPGVRVRRARLSLFAEISERRPCAPRSSPAQRLRRRLRRPPRGLGEPAAEGARGRPHSRTSRRKAGLSTLFMRRTPWGAKLDLHAAASYSWSNPPRRSRRLTCSG
jgi:hypothetical protein